MKTPDVDDSDLTQIIIQPDGRIYVFGLTVPVAEVLEELKRQTELPALVAQKPDGFDGARRYNDPGGVNGEG